MVTKLIRGVFVSLRFVAVFFVASFLFAGETTESFYQNPEFQKKRDRFFLRLRKTIKQKDKASILKIINSLQNVPNHSSNLEKCLLRDSHTKAEAIQAILDSDFASSFEIMSAIKGIMNGLRVSDRDEIFSNFPSMNDRSD